MTHSPGALPAGGRAAQPTRASCWTRWTFRAWEVQYRLPLMADVPAMTEGWRACEKRAGGLDHVVFGHGPLALARFPAVPSLRDLVRVDLTPVDPGR